jgi:hypothetical protein
VRVRATYVSDDDIAGMRRWLGEATDGEREAA